MFFETSDFIQKQGASRRLFHQAGAVRVRTGECAFAVPEKGVRKHRVVQACDIDRNEFSLSSAQLMEHTGEQFLACAAFAGYEDGARARRNCLDIHENGLHGRMCRYDRGKFFGMVQGPFHDPPAQHVVFTVELADVQRMVKAGDQARFLYRLGYVIEGPGLHAFNGDLDPGRSGGNNDRQVGVQQVHFPQDFLPRDLRHGQIEDNCGKFR